MGTIKRIYKRGIAFIISLITVLSVTMTSSPVTVFADQRVYSAETAKGYAGSMFKTYMNGGQDDLKIQDITENEFRAFGVLMSNFLIPLYSPCNNLSKKTDLTGIKYLDGTDVKEYVVWKQFCKLWMKSDASKDGSLLVDLKNKYENCFDKKNMKQLYCCNTINDTKGQEKEAYVYDLFAGRRLAQKGNSLTNKGKVFAWVDGDELKPVYTIEPDGYGKVIASFIRQLNLTRVHNLAFDGDEVNEKYKLYVSAFGDICTIVSGDTIVLIPACMNTMSFMGRGTKDYLEMFKKIYINNMIMISNFMNNTDIQESEIDILLSDGQSKLTSKEKHIFNEDGTLNIKDGLPLNKCEKVGADVFGSYFNTEIAEPGGWRLSLSESMLMSADSMVPFVQINSHQLCIAGLTFKASTDASKKADKDGTPITDDKENKVPGNTYAVATQPLWSMASIVTTKHCTLGIVSRSSLLDSDKNNIVYNNSVNRDGKIVQDDYTHPFLLGAPYNVYNVESKDWDNGVPGWVRSMSIIDTEPSGNFTLLTNYVNKSLSISDSLTPVTYTGSDREYLNFRAQLNVECNKSWADIKKDKEDGHIGASVRDDVVKFFNTKAEGSNVNNAEVASEDKETKYLVISVLNNTDDTNPDFCHSGNPLSGYVATSTGLYQIPLKNVVSKLGLFGDFWDNEDNLTHLKTINYTDDGEGTVLNKTGHDAKGYGSNYNNCNSSWTNAEDNDASCVYMPEFLYTLNTDTNKSNTMIFGDSGMLINMDRNLFTNIYWAYIEDIVGITSDDINNGISNEALGLIEQERTFPHLPKIPNGSDFKNKLFSADESDDDALAALDEQAVAERNDDIADKIHKILNIGETIGNGLRDAAAYVTNWLKAMVDSLFIGWHNHMIGVDTTAGLTGSVSNIGNATKSGTYSTAMGYMTTPTFNSLPITGWIMANFTFIYVVLMIFIVVILLMMVITRARRLPQAILIFVCMAFLIILPANMLNGAISISNEAAEKTFSNKFQYWAVMQHAEYLVNQSSAKNANQSALLDNLDRNSESTKVGGVTLKWMAPKKWGIAEQLSAATNNAKGLRLFLYLAGDVLDQEDYSNYQAGDTYIYRPYLALFTEAHSLHKRQQNEVHSDKITGVDMKEENALYRVSQYIVNQWNLNNDKYKVLNSMYDDSKLGSFNLEKNGTYKTKEVKIGKETVKVSNNFFRYTTYRDDSILRSAVGGTGAGFNGVRSYKNAYYDSYYGNASIITDKNNMYKNNERIYDMYLDEQLIKCLFTFNVNNVYWGTENVDKSCGLWLSNRKNPNTRSYTNGQQEQPEETYYSAGVQTFFDYSESPYYYFYNVFSDMMIHTDNGSKISGSEDFLALLLSDETFKVTNQQSPAYGEFKDYLDMEGLFKFVIPLLDYGNGNASKYFETYGSTVERTDFLDDSTYSGSSKTESSKAESSKAESSSDSSESSGETSEEESKVEESSETEQVNSITKDPETKAEDSYNKHKQQLQAVYNMYCPWVDQFLAANTKSERIKSGYGWVELINPCNPADYQYFGRPMAFSKAEAVIRGYKDYDLSTVETKIQKVLKDSYYDIIELINYKDLTSIVPTDSSSYAAKEGWTGNEILVSAAAMIATFHFNQEFSDNGFMSTDITLYPQSYELKNMNFDAYLRIIMGNSMGINQVSLMRSDSNSMTVYEEFIHETSIFSALILIIEDLLAVFIIPLLKIMLITVIFVLALALAVSCIINRPENMIKIFLTTYLLPLFAMIAIFVAHTVVISWFVGEGSSAGLIDTHSISVTTGDPTVTLLLMIVVDLGTSILMWKLLKYAAKSTAKYLQDIASGVASLTGGTFNGLAKIITAAAGVGTLAVGTARAVGGAAKSTVKGAVGVGKGIAHHSEVRQTKKRDEERNDLLRKGNGKGTGSNRQNNGTNGNKQINSNNNNKNDNNNSGMAADVKAIRKKLEQGFNPNNMRSENNANGKTTEQKKPIKSQANGNAKPSAEAQKKNQEFTDRRARANADKAKADPAAARQQAKQLHDKKKQFDDLRRSSGAKFDKATGKWTADRKVDADKMNRLQYEITKGRKAQHIVQSETSRGPSKFQQVKSEKMAQAAQAAKQRMNTNKGRNMGKGPRKVKKKGTKKKKVKRPKKKK